jgi:hypothetical protein
VRPGEGYSSLESSGVGRGGVMGELSQMFPGDENRPKPMQRRLNFNVQSPEDKRIWAKLQRVISLYSDLYKKEHASSMIPNPKPSMKVHQKKKLREIFDDLDESEGTDALLTMLMFVYRFWQKDIVSGEYDTVKWAKNRNWGAFVSDAAIDELKTDWKIKRADLGKVRRMFADYLEGFEGGQTEYDEKVDDKF